MQKNDNVVKFNKDKEQALTKDAPAPDTVLKEYENTIENTIVSSEDGTLTLDFFGDIKAKQEEEEKKKIEEEKARKEATEKNKSKINKRENQQAKKESVKINRDWTISYAAQSYTVSEFITDLKDGDEVEVEVLRQKMEEEFFEFSKQRTRFEFDLERRIVFPIVTGSHKGATNSQSRFFLSSDDVLSDSKRIQYIPGKDGAIYEIKDGIIGRMVTRSTHIPFLENINETFEFKLPKIPGNILDQIISFFTANYKYEAMVQIYWDHENKSYSVYVPKQEVSKISIKYDNILTQRYQLVMEIHSHNSMDAYFSAIDNANELAYLLYGVVGNIDKNEVSIKVRAGYNGKFISLPLEYIFEDINLSSKYENYPLDWNNNIQIIEVKNENN